ncbi:hypothetical protein GCM10007242_16370 [Pigmentiphaga litoralis]|uniref:hypothetical protein n=1 Tax=Pigmentiphaga litoralis TaxID=516702 RepID=UPI0016725D51|nr:hypothetical protein [Pigmentiphaga litoralis]GGX11062.1 hypothetical protein GCM10007242_16370 [Pigmentiphaga litoralis]
MDDTIIITVKAVLAFICWLIVAVGAGLAIFAPQINDTLSERIGLSAISITAFGTAWRVVSAGWASDGGTALSVALAGYVLAIAAKHTRRYSNENV